MLGCSAGLRSRAAVPRYIVTASPIDVGTGAPGLCVAVDPSTEHGVWWWEPGASGCASRSTAPGVFEADQATVSHATESSAIDVRFRVGLHSIARPFAEIHLVIEDGSMRVVASGARVPVLRRPDLDVPTADGSLDRQ
jgi:hypothetical protein